MRPTCTYTFWYIHNITQEQKMSCLSYLMIFEAAFSLPLCRRLYAVNILHLAASRGSSISMANDSCFNDNNPACSACRIGEGRVQGREGGGKEGEERGGRGRAVEVEGGRRGEGRKRGEGERIWRREGGRKGGGEGAKQREGGEMREGRGFTWTVMLSPSCEWAPPSVEHHAISMRGLAHSNNNVSHT